MLAVQALCAYEALGEAFDAQLPEFLHDEENLQELEIATPVADEIFEFASALARGAWSRRETIDGLLSRTVAHWSVARLTPVDRAILRLGVHELLENPPDRPPQVVINESLELARKFGEADSPAFINGVLDAVRRGLAERGVATATGQEPGTPPDGKPVQ